MRKQAIWVTLPICAAIVAAGTWLARAGDLNPPPGAVQPTNRVQLNGQAITLPYTINQSGSYVLTSNLTGTAGSSGIIIQADDVDIDLNGFELIGGGGTLSGIIINGWYTTVTVHDGQVREWGNDGIDLGNGERHHVYKVTVEDNNSNGVIVGPSSIVRNVIVVYNEMGIEASENCKLTNCIANNNSSDGIVVGNGSHVSDSVAAHNGMTGISLGEHCVLIGSTARENNEHGVVLNAYSNVTDCTSSGNGAGGVVGSGFALDGPGSQLFDCVAADNWDDGFEMLYSGTHEPNSVQACTAASNGVSGSGNGFSWIRKVIGCFATGNQTNGIALMGGVCIASVAYENANTGIWVWDCTVADCEANYNDDGIWAEDSVVKNNTVVYNQNDGIVLGIGCLVWRNNCSENFDDGIEAQGDGNTIEGNNCYNNMADAIDSSLAGGNAVLSNREKSNPGGYNLNWAADTWGPISAGPGPVITAAGAQFVNISY